MSLHFQCRFYLLSESFYNEREKIEVDKNTHPIFYYKCKPQLHPSIFNKDKKRDFREFKEFLEKIKSLNPKKHQSFINACNSYLKALKQVGIDQELVWIRLIISIESLLGTYKLKKHYLQSFENIAQHYKFTVEHRELLKELLVVDKNGLIPVGKTTNKFIEFIMEHSEGYLPSNIKKETERLYINTKEKLLIALPKIYNVRSRTSHNGKAMYFSMILNNNGMDWHTDPSISPDDDLLKGLNSPYNHPLKPYKLPYPWWFEGLVRHCIISYLESSLI